MEIEQFISSVLGEQEETAGETQAPAVVQDDPRPFLTTPFEEYTVTEGLLLTLVLCAFISAVVKILKEGFYWLL